MSKHVDYTIDVCTDQMRNEIEGMGEISRIDINLDIMIACRMLRMINVSKCAPVLQGLILDMEKALFDVRKGMDI